MNKNTLLGILVLVVLGVVLMFVVNRPQAPFDNNNGNGQAINFREEGNIVQNNPGLTPDTWYLVYEKPGSAAITQELRLTDSDNLRFGQRVYVEGVMDDQVVEVTSYRIVSAYNDDLIWVSSPRPNDIVSSPLTIGGEARGTWYFEASFPVKLLDANGKVLTQAPATAQGEWMTEDYVPFSITLNFTNPTTSTGTLVLEKDNPSGLSENANELRVPVRFTESQQQTRAVDLYYYDPTKDQDVSGNVMCTRDGLVAVQREIPISQTPIQDTIRLLLQGALTSAEKSDGITTEYPLPGFELVGANLVNGVLTLEFNDPQNKTVGGACRVGVLWFQIEATAKQFSEVNEVRFKPEELFQP